MAGHLLILLESAVEHPDYPITRLPILGAQEREQVVRQWNSTTAPYAHERCVHDMFADQVERFPEAEAVIFGDAELSYDELNRRANQVARHLKGLGVGPDQVVGICVERGFAMVVGVLGILKAGAAYLPLDPAYPTERLRYMLMDAAPRVVMMQEAVRSRLPPSGSELVALDANNTDISVLEDANLPSDAVGAGGQHLAFVIYTSGSTGAPKGTAMTHGSMVNLLEWHRRIFGSATGARVLQFAALSFDVAFQEVFSTLCTGGTLVLLDEWVRRDVRALTLLLRDQNIERAFLPPLMLQSLAEHCASTGELPSGIRDIVAAGEQLRVTEEIVALFRRLNDGRLHNHYGPTETHVVTALTLSGAPEEWPALPSIGRPIANVQIHVLDEEGQPVPIGVRGEIHIGGVALAREYLGRPELTSQRFIRDPFAADSRARLYKTGDVGRWRAAGTVEFLGRNDHQVKIRGYRIELAEIEATLARHGQVKDVVVVALEVAAGGRSLVAYVTPRGESRPEPASLRAHLTEYLPDYMVPAMFVLLESLPLTPSGKLDRCALPAPDQGAYASRPYEPPQGELEQALAQVWKGLLLVERVGRHDNFFELGGHSLLSVKLVARVSDVLGAQLSVITVFRHPTIERLARVLESSRASARAASPNLAEFVEGSL
jgi:amino acid adenylation domain-containing protein